MLGRLDEKRMVCSFKWGFLSDRIVETVNDYNENMLFSDDEHIISSARDLLSNILKGEKQYADGKYSLNALESFKIYNRSMNIISTEEFLSAISHLSSDPSIKELVTIMDGAFEKIMNNKPLIGKEITILLNFFNMLRDLTLKESQGVLDNYYESRGNRIWAYPAKSML